MKNKTSLMIILSVLVIGCAPTRKYATQAQEEWEEAMQQFDALNAQQTYPDNAILFAGSSSIRLWDSINEDMAPYPVIQRGYGGAAFTDLAYYIERIVYPHSFSALVVFAGNDIWGNESDRSPEEITKLFDHIVKRVAKKYGDTPVFVIEVTHVPVRAHLIAEVDAENKVLEAVANRYDHVHWIPTKDIYLTPDGKVNQSLFGEDNVHQNPEGYKLWTKRIKQNIKSVLE